MSESGDALQREIEERMRRSFAMDHGVFAYDAQVFDAAISVCRAMIEEERKRKLTRNLDTEESRKFWAAQECSHTLPLTTCAICYAELRERAEAAEKALADRATMFYAAARDLHISAKHDGDFGRCEKHKCLHLRESIR